MGGQLLHVQGVLCGENNRIGSLEAANFDASEAVLLRRSLYRRLLARTDGHPPHESAWRNLDRAILIPAQVSSVYQA